MILLFYCFIKPDSTVQDFDASKLVVVQIMGETQQLLKDTLNFTGLFICFPQEKKKKDLGIQ